MGIPLKEIIKQLPLEEQKEIEKRSAELLAEEMTPKKIGMSGSPVRVREASPPGEG